ncbi:MAG: glycosyltransferase family 4 protein [Bacilli bacterium]
MKILFYIGNLRKGGAERVVVTLSNNLVKSNDVTIITTTDEEPEYELDKNINLFNLKDFKGNKNSLSKNMIYLKKLKKYIKEINPDIVLGFLPEPSYRLLLLKPFIKVPVIISDRNDPKIEYASFKNKIIMKWLYHRADGFVFQTSEAQNYFSKKIQSKSTVIANPVDDKFFNVNYCGENSKEFINVGRLNEQKNQIFLIESFKEIIKKYPDYKLLIYGDGDMKEELSSYIIKNKLNDNVKLCGNVDNIENFLKDKKGFILSSKYEGMPNALMEAMAVGLPCISTDCPCGGPRELIKNNKSGLLIENENKEQLISSIIYIIENREKCISMSKTAKKGMNNYNCDNITAKWLDFMKEVCECEKNN